MTSLLAKKPHQADYKPISSDPFTKADPFDEVPLFEKPKEVEPEEVEPEAPPLDYKSIAEDIAYFCDRSDIRLLLEDSKLRKRIDKITTKLGRVLKSFKQLNINDEHLQEIFVLVLQSLEDYIFVKDKKQCKILKREIAINLLVVFTNDDREICTQMIKFLEYKVKPTTLFRRNKKTLYKIGCWCLRKLM